MKLKDYLEKWKDDPSFLTERLVLRIVDDLYKIMEERGINQSGLADRLGVSKVTVSKFFQGSQNLTLRKLMNVCVALEVRPEVDFRDVVETSTTVARTEVEATAHDLETSWCQQTVATGQSIELTGGDNVTTVDLVKVPAIGPSAEPPRHEARRLGRVA